MLLNRTFPLLVLLLGACSSAPPVVKAPTTPAPSQLPKPVKQEIRAEQWLALASEADAREQPLLLLRAAQAWQAQERCDNSLKVLSVLLPYLQDTDTVEGAHLLQAECLLTLQQGELAAQSLSKVRSGGQYLVRKLTVSAALAERSNQPLRAAAEYAELVSLDPPRASALYPKIWSLLQQVDDQTLASAGNHSPYLSPWVQLASSSRQLQGAQLRAAIDAWQKQHADLPLPTGLQQLSGSSWVAPRDIAVLLPMSGRLASQGEALRDGMLAAYFDAQADNGSTPLTLRFFDSNRVDDETIEQIVTQSDFVVGPLLKENISPLLSAIPAHVPMLVLNRLDEPRLLENRYFFALAPEDEAEQLSAFLADKGYRRPVVVSAERPLFERMAQSFNQHWQQMTGQAPKWVTFNDNKSMRSAMEGLLDVQHSKQRIRQVEKLVKQEVHQFARSRRDVDAIVVFASPGQTELLNPIIESSISPFAAVVPVFATSHSFSQELGANSFRDLRNLTFLDMPWMLDQDLPLKVHSQALWPNRNDGQSRLFAMGYDAFNLVPSLPRMAAIAGIRQQGLSGTLSMDKVGQIHRQLPMAKISQEKVIRLAMD